MIKIISYLKNLVKPRPQRELTIDDVLNTNLRAGEYVIGWRGELVNG
jgi:hypothetical protein